MALFRKFFYRKPPDGLLEISERVYVFDCCFTTDVSEEDEYKVYVGSIVAQLREHFPDASVMVFNFREGVSQSQISSILSEYDMTVMDYPRQYEGCPLLTMEMIHHFLRSSESWLSLGQQNILLMHCERGGWPVLAFMLAALLVYHKQYAGEQRTLDMIYKQAPRELLQLLSPLNPLPSQLRYLHYVSRRNVGSEWPPFDRALTLDCVILRFIPDFDGTGGCRPLFRIYGQDPFLAADRTPRVLFSMPKKSKLVRFYKQEDCELVKIDIHCHIQGDVVLECISLEEDLQREEMMFRVMFNTAFIRSNILMLDRDAIDILWDAKDRFPKNFRVEILLSEMDSPNSMASLELINVDEKEGLPVEAFDKVKEMFNNLDWLETKPDTAMKILQQVASSKSLQEKLDSVSPMKSEADVFLTELSPDILLEEIISSENSDRKKKAFLPPSKMDSVPLHKISDSNSENNAELHGLQVLAKFPSLILQRTLSQSTPAFSSNSSPSCHPTVSRYHNALSPLGIMTLLDDHAASDTSEANIKKIASTSSVSGSTILSESPQQLSPAQLLTTSVGYTKEASSSPQCLSSAPVPPTLAKEASVEPAYITPPPPPPPLQPLLPPPPAQPTSPPIRVFSLAPPPCSLAHLPPPPPPPLPPKVTARAPTSIPPPRPPSLRVSSSMPAPPLPLPLLHTACATKTEDPTVRKQLVPVDIVSTSVKDSSSEVPPSPAIPSHLRNSTQSTSIPTPPPPPPPPPLKDTSSPLPSAGLEKSTASSVAQQVGIMASKSIPSPPPPPLVTLPIPKANISLLGKVAKTPDVPLPPAPPQPVSEVALSAPPPPPLPHISSNNSGGSSSKTLPSPLVPSAVPPSSLKSLSVPYSSGAKGTISEAIPPPPLSGMNVSPPPPPPCSMNAPLPPPPPSAMNTPPPPSSMIAPPPPPPPRGMNAPPPPPPLRGMNAPPPPPSSMNAPPPPPSGMNAALLGGKGQLPSRTPTSRNFQSNQPSSKKSNLKPLHWVKVTRAVQGSLWAESQNTDEFSKAPEFDMSELESLFSTAVPSPNIQGAGSKSGRSTGPKFDKVHLIDLRRANNCEIMLTKVKMPMNDLMSSVLALDDSILDIDQIENLIKFCPTKEEMELLKAYNGDRENLGKCEQYFLELMKVPRVESKLRVFAFKIQFRSQVADLKGNLNIVKTASEEIRGSVKLKRIMQTILSLGNALNQGTARGSAVGFRLDSLLKLSDTRARNNKMTLMHYLCKVLAEKLPELLDFPKSLVCLEAASKMQLKILAEEMQAINKGLEKVEHELTASENDGPVSQVFCQTLKGFLVGAEAEVRSLTSLYSSVGRNADALALYFGEDPARCPFEQAVLTLLNFVKLFTHAHEDNCKQLELEKKKAQKEAEVEKVKVTNSKKEPQNTQSPADVAQRK